MKQAHADSQQNNYRRLRIAIGYLGFLLPIVLILLSSIDFFDTKIRTSISHFYYTNLRDIFTGTLFAVGFFMIRYKGLGNKVWYKNDNLLTNIAGIMALAVALLPTFPEPGDNLSYTFLPLKGKIIGTLHYIAAATLFSAFSLLSIFVFTIGQEKNTDIPISPLNENYIYKFCGYSIFLFIILIYILGRYKIEYSTLVLEFLSLIAFGISWLIKGRALGDKGKMGRMIYREHNEK